jgi:pentaxin family protein
MPRDLSVASAEAATRERGEHAHLLELDFGGGTVRFTSGPHDVLVDPKNPYCARIGATIGRYLIRNPVGTWPTTSLTVEYWGRLDTGLSTSETNNGFSYARSAQANEILCNVDTSGGNWRQGLFINGTAVLDVDNYPNDHAWHHLAWTWRSSDGAWVMYLDGVQVASGSGLQTGYSIAAGGAVVLGQDQDSLGGGFDATQAWKGELDEVRVYSRVLSGTEIAEHFAGTFSDETGLVGYWTFNYPTGNLLSNPGGESGSVGWITGAGMTIENDAGNARTGSWVLKYATDGAGGPNFINNLVLPVSPGDVLYLEAWMKAPTGTGDTGLAVRWFMADLSQIGGRVAVQVLTGPVAAYTKASGFATAPEGAAFAKFDLGENPANNTATPWYFDDCVMMHAKNLGADDSPAGNHLTIFGITTPSPDTRGAQTYSAAGAAMTFAPVGETVDYKGQRLRLILDGVSLGAVAAMLAEDYIGREGRLWRAHIADGRLVGRAVLLFRGLMNSSWEATEDIEQHHARVETELAGPLAVLEQVRGITADEHTHQAIYPGDTFFSHIATKPHGDFGWGILEKIPSR